MTPIPSLRSIVASGLLIALATIGLSGQESASGYLFLGTEPSAKSGKSYFPIATMDKKKIHVDEGTKLKKVSPSSPCRVSLKTKISSQFVEVLNLDFDNSSMANLRRSSDAVADMQLADSQSEAKIDLLRKDGASEAQMDEVKQQSDEFQDRVKKDVDDGNFELDELADTVFVKGEFLPKTDVIGAYCIVVVTSRNQDFKSREYTGKYQGARAKYIGDLSKGEIRKFKLRFALNEFNLRRAEYQFHLFSESGEQVAMSNSRALKGLTDQEFQKFNESLGAK